ncbi:MAG: type II secretion system protein GspG [Planctomycetota bacterium]
MERTRRRVAPSTLWSVTLVALGTAMLMAVHVSAARSDVRFSTARRGVESLSTTVKLLEARTGRLPADGPELRRRVVEVADVPDALLVDPWGRPYRYSRMGAEGWRIASLGADGRPGGEGWDTDIEVMRHRGSGR